jgi:TonB family protein
MGSGPRTVPVIGSIAAHAIFFVWLFSAPPPKSQSAYDQLIKPREDHLVWYNFKRKLPDVSPMSKAAQNQPLKAEILEKQSIVSSPADAPKAPQMIFHPVPQLKPQPVTPLPNIIALAAPPPPQKQFVAPKPVDVKRASPQIAEPAPVPELKASVKAPDLPKLPNAARPFTAPPERRAKLTMKVQTADAPELNASRAALSASAAKALDQASRTMAFRPQPKRSLTASVGSMPDTPVLQGANSSSANVAVVGLNPIDNLNVPLPEGSRRAQFSAGPKLNPNGAASAGKSSGIAVPDLTVRGGDSKTAPDIIARTMSPDYNAPASLASVRATAHEGARHMDTSDDIRRPPGTAVSGAPDPHFLGRQVFSVAIQSPNLTSHEGSWLMWYADRAEMTYRALISAPQPLHKVDPKYIATAAEEKVEGTVRLRFVISSDGRVYGVETVKGIDARLDRSAVEALSKWQFTPALREGKPIDVDALVEIPFRLAPPEPK